MASLPQISATLGACTRTKNNINIPCIAQLYNKRQCSNLVASHQIAKSTFSPLALVGQKKPIRDLRKLCQNEKWKTWCSDDGSCGVAPEFLLPPSKVQLVRDFYDAFNTKDTQGLEQLLSPQCVYEDFLLYVPHEGKESVMNLLQSAMDAMGASVRIEVEDIKQGNHGMAIVFWHLEWNKKKIPFTTGCRFFTFEEVEGRLFISKITGVEELPVKPGELVLKLLKSIRTLFDSYPLPAKAILESHASQDGSADGGINTHFDLFGRKH